MYIKSINFSNKNLSCININYISSKVINEDLMVLRLALYYSYLFKTIKGYIVRFDLTHNYPFHFRAPKISAKILIYFEVRAYGIYIYIYQ